MNITKVHGRLLAPFFVPGVEDPVPLSGALVFTPFFESERGIAGVHLPSVVRAELDIHGRFQVGLLRGAWSWYVQGRLYSGSDPVSFRGFYFTPVGEEMDFSNIVPTDSPNNVPGASGDSIQWVDNGDGTGRIIIRSKD